MPDTKKEGEKSRRDTLDDDGLDIVLPECDAEYLLEYLFELGMTLGDRPLDHTEIASWQSNTGMELQPFEVRIIKRLSQAYLSASSEYKDPDSETPWVDAPRYMSRSYRNAMLVKASLRRAAEI